MFEIVIDKPFTTSAVRLETVKYNYASGRLGFVGQVTVEEESPREVGRAYVESKFRGANGGVFDRATWTYEDSETGNVGHTWDDHAHNNWAKPYLDSATGFHRARDGRNVSPIATFAQPVVVQKLVFSKRGDIAQQLSNHQAVEKAVVSCKGTDGKWVEWGEVVTGITRDHTHTNYMSTVPVKERTCLAVKIKPTAGDVRSGRFGFIGRVPELPFGDEQAGFCVKPNGQDQNSGVIKLMSGDHNSDAKKLECLKACAEQPNFTGCEVIWDQDNRGCYAHT